MPANESSDSTNLTRIVAERDNLRQWIETIEASDLFDQLGAYVDRLRSALALLNTYIVQLEEQAK